MYCDLPVILERILISRVDLSLFITLNDRGDERKRL